MTPRLRALRVATPTPSSGGAPSGLAEPAPRVHWAWGAPVSWGAGARLAVKAQMRARGFTLIELLVALAAMALLATMSWRGLDAMARTQTNMRERADAVLTLQAALAQWSADLDAIIELQQARAIDWNGQTLRLTRRGSDITSPALFVVSWTSDGTRWRRWQSPALSTRADWQRAWDTAASWAQSEGNGGVTLIPLRGWQLFYFRNGAWVSASTGAATPVTGIPDGLRLVLDMPPGSGLQGALTRDWVRPTLVVSKS